MIFSKSTWQHLRIPFSIFLMPVFSFAAWQSSYFSIEKYILIWIILHLFLYPASNGYNSYFDKDEGSIGGVEKPLQVSKELYFVSLLFDVIALLLGWIAFDIVFMLSLFLYGLASKAYSHKTIRLKKYPIISWLIVSFFQGFFTYFIVWIGFRIPLFSQDFDILFYQSLYQDVFFPTFWQPALFTSLLIGAAYPMTQIYQHQEDRSRGDRTLSLLLGIKGTFLFTGLGFSLATVYFFLMVENLQIFTYFILFLSPVLFFFSYWAWQVLQTPKAANFKNTMRLNMISSLMMIICFSFFMILKQIS
ncbi:UbiA family prenyltransferase [Hugenholtzia roseola]|uniref:UbiA family prenyltransferase n=1 Tax=Hugenholtzia roseola TaxID=1002 RepID=UPI000422231A|nr:UbiA family prenyltransferase [Hugenholtzia roseola]